MKKKFLGLLIFITTYASSQTYTTNFNVNTNNKDIKSIVDIWQSYLKTNSKEYWNTAETKDLKNFNILNIEGVINPSLMNWNFSNLILSVNLFSEDSYLIKSIFEGENKSVFAITNVLAKKENGNFKLSNYLFDYTKNWRSHSSENITYFYRPDYILNVEEVSQAEKFYSELCKTFNLKSEKLTYFIAKDCDNIYDILGYEYIFSKGMSKECGYYEIQNNYIFATEKAGANHYHEITHFINKFYPNANYLLLTGVSAYLSGEKAHFGKPLIYHIKRVNEYLEKNKEISLSKPFDFYKLDENTNPQYVIGGLLCDLIIERQGKNGLIEAFKNTKSDEEFLQFLQSKVLKKNENLNDVLRKKIKEISKTDEFPNRLKN
ncbi:hypothetical protein ACFQO9_15940 [Chryseobacterium zhengzhouense]|uniref:Uncharacterized protein n=1 Tax=Chryseobacterium zhengzhouense TaxID=1636086 RepID=A0ABW2M036_9FLAO